jgi:mannosyltransferase
MSAFRRASAVAALTSAVGVGAWLRLDRLGGPSFWVDEILGQTLTTAAARQPWWRWLLGLEREHGALYYLTQLAARLFGDGESAGRAPAAFFGILAIVAIAWSARRLGRIEAVASAALLALSPLAVYYSREARPYALLTLLAALLVGLLLRRGPMTAFGCVIAAILYTSAVGGTLVAGAALAAAAAALLGRDPHGRRWDLRAAVIATAALPLFPLYYRGEPPTSTAAGFPALDLRFFETLLRTFTVSALGEPAHGRAAIAMLALAIAGAVALLVRARREAIVVITMTLAPLLLALASLRFFSHWYAVRYVIHALPPFLVLVACGLVAIPAAALARRRGGIAATAVIVALLVVVLGTQVLQAARSEAFRKLDWRRIAQALWSHARPGDYLVTAEPWSDVALRYYLGRLPQRLEIAQAGSAGLAQMIVSKAPATWVASAGYGGETETRGWGCGLPLLLSSELENLRIHFAPSAGYFARDRSLPEDQRAIAAAMGSGFNFRFSPGEEFFLGGGWFDAERVGDQWMRWIHGTQATVAIPLAPDAFDRIRLRGLPFDQPGLPPQIMTLSLNGFRIASMPMADGWNDYEVAVPPGAKSEALNILTLDFSRASRPADADPRSPDVRRLSAAFQSISAGVTSDAPQETPDVRLAAGRMVDDSSVWLSGFTRFAPSKLSHDSVSALLGRLGFDPLTTWPRLAAGDLQIEDVIRVVAADSQCEGDEAFLTTAFRRLLRRSPNDVERRDLLGRLDSGATRESIVQRIARSDDFRALVLRTP